MWDMALVISRFARAASKSPKRLSNQIQIIIKKIQIKSNLSSMQPNQIKSLPNQIKSQIDNG
jgi:hypothetical protein